MTNSNTVIHSNRIHTIDALRGFALMGIVIVHMLEQFIAAPAPAESGWFLEPTLVDNIINGISALLLQGKFFALFSILFGISFGIMMQSAAKKGQNFSGRFLWRLVLLAIIGLVHNAFYRGDILLIYAMIGMFLPLFYQLSTKWLWITAALLLSGIPRVIFYTIFGSMSFMENGMSPTSPELIEYMHTLNSGQILEVFWSNSTMGIINKLDFQFGLFSRGYATLAYFLIGLGLTRIGLFARVDEERARIKKIMWIAFALVPLFVALTITFFANIEEPIDSTWLIVPAFTFYDFANIALTCGIFCAFLLLFNPLKNSGQFLQSYGRMALTNYVFQSIIGTFILFGWGLGLIGQYSSLVMLCFAIGMIAIQVIFSRWWLKRYLYGPLEWLWRCGTYLKWLPIKGR